MKLNKKVVVYNLVIFIKIIINYLVQATRPVRLYAIFRRRNEKLNGKEAHNKFVGHPRLNKVNDKWIPGKTLTTSQRGIKKPDFGDFLNEKLKDRGLNISRIEDITIGSNDSFYKHESLRNCSCNRSDAYTKIALDHANDTPMNSSFKINAYTKWIDCTRMVIRLHTVFNIMNKVKNDSRNHMQFSNNMLNDEKNKMLIKVKVNQKAENLIIDSISMTNIDSTKSVIQSKIEELEAELKFYKNLQRDINKVVELASKNNQTPESEKSLSQRKARPSSLPSLDSITDLKLDPLEHPNPKQQMKTSVQVIQYLLQSGNKPNNEPLKYLLYRSNNLTGKTKRIRQGGGA
jgi:hypothetical protein